MLELQAANPCATWSRDQCHARAASPHDAETASYFRCYHSAATAIHCRHLCITAPSEAVDVVEPASCHVALFQLSARA
ncbi:hypothetical protein NDU88_002241 [Pleurodeles waltl]|uniref:Uncharacterized protein n=1 Tax=Pleurodeles waltl TaxID=8319 RepID=A0AAV7SC44_PLEWA|nr:hypothetical protein NDU88_002241 [Pleurodeles waltl]